MCGATLRALTADAQLQWSGHMLYRDQAPVPLQAPHQNLDALAQTAMRAVTDGAALRLLYSDRVLFDGTAPKEPVAHLVFEMLEQLRVESLAPAPYAGLVHNIHAHFCQWSERFAESGLTETSAGILIFTIANTAWSRLNSLAPSDAFADLMESTRANIMPALGGHFAALRRHRSVQADYASAALAISQWVAQALDNEAARGGAERAPRRRNGFSLPLHFNAPVLDPFAQATSAQSKAWDATQQQYRVYTRQYDREVSASTLVREAQLREFREAMDLEVEQADLNLNRLVRTLQRGLSHPMDDGWEFEQEAGQLDGQRLAQLVASPAEHHIFKTRAQQPHADCAVALLLDCSGSMKNHIQQVSLLADVLARALDRAGVASEVLGFTTGAWNGGRARRDWMRAGSPALPGRLNEQMHLVFKPAATAWKRARLGLAALRKPDVYKEGVDAEALLWASQRLLALPARRRILLVVSDGCPMDTATHAANDAQYLDQHLHSVLRQLQSQSGVEVCALGVGLDLGVFYRHRLAVDLANGLTDALLLDIAALLCQRRRRVRH